MTARRGRLAAKSRAEPREARRKQAGTAPRTRRRRTRGRALIGLGLGIAGGFVLTFFGTLFVWSIVAGPGSGTRVTVTLESQEPSAIAQTLRASGVLQSPALFAWYLRIVRPTLALELGPHLLNDALTPAAIAGRLARAKTRPLVRLVVPEGFNMFQLGARLEELEICGNDHFQEQAQNRALLKELGVPADSVEGHLFPASYELFVDSEASAVISLLVGEMARRFERLRASRPGALERLAAEFQFGKSEVLTLASMIEKETASPDERPLIASVFYNRLRGTAAHPSRLLQSDPTAAYGCLLAPSAAPTCLDYHGRVTPAMLRDAQNRYNTYRHPGLPPGPIANPGERAIESTLAPAASDYLFFVANGAGRHIFSRTFDEHANAIRQRQTQSP
jgi:UPF0755 protein